MLNFSEFEKQMSTIVAFSIWGQCEHEIFSNIFMPAFRLNWPFWLQSSSWVTIKAEIIIPSQISIYTIKIFFPIRHNPTVNIREYSVLSVSWYDTPFIPLFFVRVNSIISFFMFYVFSSAALVSERINDIFQGNKRQYLDKIYWIIANKMRYNNNAFLTQLCNIVIWFLVASEVQIGQLIKEGTY